MASWDFFINDSSSIIFPASQDTDSEQSEPEEHESERETKSAHFSPSLERKASPPPPPLQRRLTKAEILENVVRRHY